MFTALVNFIQYHITETIMAFFAPILKHCTVDGYVLNFYFIILEFSETYGIITIAFLFTILMIYYRNTIFNVYKISIKFITNNNYRKNIIIDLPKRLVNYTKMLNNKIYNRTYKTSSIIYSITTKF